MKAPKFVTNTLATTGGAFLGSGAVQLWRGHGEAGWISIAVAVVVLAVNYRLIFLRRRAR